MKQKSYSIICLQDIHVDPDIEEHVAAEWGFESVICPFQSNARCIGIFFNNNFEFTIKRVKKELSNGYVIVEMLIGTKSVVIVNVYGPNSDKPAFYADLSQSITDFENTAIIPCGDWNLVLKPDQDTDRYLHINNPNARKSVLE